MTSTKNKYLIYETIKAHANTQSSGELCDLDKGLPTSCQQTPSLKFRFVFWDVLPCKIIVDRRFRGTCCLHHSPEISQAPSCPQNYFRLRAIILKKENMEEIIITMPTTCSLLNVMMEIKYGK
jgi:hypothetical protein